MSSLFNSIKSGYCRICGRYGRFTEDHIPPEKCFNGKPIYVNRPYNYEIAKGLKVNSICEQCNNKLLGGQYDNELKSFVSQIDDNYLLSVEHSILFKNALIHIDKEKVLRGVLGHLLSCYGSQKELKSEIKLDEDCYSNRMRQYVLGANNQFYEEIRFLFWIHPHKSIKILPYISMTRLFNIEFMLVGSLLSFYPVGIFIIQNAELTLFKDYKLNELIIDGTSDVKINIAAVMDEDFPFSIMKTNQEIMFLTNSEYFIHGTRLEFRN